MTRTEKYCKILLLICFGLTIGTIVYLTVEHYDRKAAVLVITERVESIQRNMKRRDRLLASLAKLVKETHLGNKRDLNKYLDDQDDRD